MAKRKHEGEKDWSNTALCVIQSGVIAVFGCILVLFLCAVLIAKGMLRESWMNGAVLFACVLSLLGAGMLQRLRNRPLTPSLGGATGLLLVLLFGGIGALVWSGISIAQGGRIMAACVFGGVLSGLLFGAPKRRRR